VPLIPLIALLLLVLVLILAMPLLLFLRYRAGTVRRRGLRWLATLNLVMIVLSAGLFLSVAAITSFWVSDAFRYSLFGLMGGCLLGLLGLALSRWEETPQALHYTPNRWLILIITLAVTARLLYCAPRGSGCRNLALPGVYEQALTPFPILILISFLQNLTHATLFRSAGLSRADGKPLKDLNDLAHTDPDTWDGQRDFIGEAFSFVQKRIGKASGKRAEK
jgi:hypothetical protein